jgi:hypothetical protein
MTARGIGPAARVRRARGCAFQDIAGETIVVLPRQRWVHLLNEVGAFVWERLAEETTPAALAGAVCAEFDVEAPEALRDIEAFLADLAEKGLIEVLGEP